MNKPIEISLPEWEEIMQVDEVKEGWGLEEGETAEQFAAKAYGVKFDFRDGSPGYAGDLYILQGEVGVALIVLIREDGKLRAEV